MVGLNRTTIIAPEWERHHRPVAVSTMTGLCRVIRPGQPGSYPAVSYTHLTLPTIYSV